MSHLKQITPMVPVSNLQNSISFFTKVLGFKLGFQADNYAFLKRDQVAIRLLIAGEGVDMTDPKRQQACYIDVEDIDILYTELKPELDKLPEGRVRAPFDTYYNQREFHVIDPDALLIFFGQGI